MMTSLSDEIEEGVYVKLRNGETYGPVLVHDDPKGLYHWYVKLNESGTKTLSWAKSGQYSMAPSMMDIAAVIKKAKVEKTMSLSTNRSYVIVRFKNGYQKYTYVAEGNKEELEQFNYAVVDAPSSGYTIVAVDSVENLDMSSYNGQYKHVVAMFSDVPYRANLNARIRKAAIEKELRQRAAERQKTIELEKLLGDDEEAMKLFEEYKNL